MKEKNTIVTFLVNSFGSKTCTEGFLEESLAFSTKKEAIAWLIDHLFERTSNPNSYQLVEELPDGNIHTIALITSLTNEYRPDNLIIYRAFGE